MLKQFIYFSVILHCACICGCKSPLAWFNEADEKAASHIKNAQNRDNLRVEKISVDNPADTLRRRLIEAQGITVADSLSATSSKEEISIDEKFKEPIYITLEDALKIAAAENREFRSKKEDLYRSALALDLEAHNFRTTFAGLMSSSLSSTRSEGRDRNLGNDNRLRLGANHKFKNGTELSSSIAFDLAKKLNLKYLNSGSIYRCIALKIMNNEIDINDEMKMAASYAIASLVSDDELNADYILPMAFDERIGKAVAKAVAEAARKSGVARL